MEKSEYKKAGKIINEILTANGIDYISLQPNYKRAFESIYMRSKKETYSEVIKRHKEEIRLLTWKLKSS